MQNKILYIEDEPYLSRIVTDTLTAKGYQVLHKKDGIKLSDTINQFGPHLCLLDVMLPHIDGFSLANIIRNIFPELPIVFLTAKTLPDDIVQGFAAGGTDYIRKPFSMEELVARIENQLRLVQKNNKADSTLPEVITLHGFKFYPTKMELHHLQNVRRLSQRENHILSMLCVHQGKALDRRLLLQSVWGDDSFFNSRNLDVYIRKLRSYFASEEKVQIITLKGQGYLFLCN